MGILSTITISFGCSAAGERLALAAKEGDLEDAKALLEYNPRLVRYSTFGMRKTPLHYAAANGHHEIVSLLIESSANINHRDCSGQTPLMQACLRGHWEVVLLLVLYKANIHKSDCLSGGTALHFAALNGHSRCIRLLLADYVPSIPEFWNAIRGSNKENSVMYFDEVGLSKIVNRKADGGITALHLAALNGHADSVRLLLDVGASFSEVTVEDGSTIDLIGAGSTALHYAACGGNAECCRVLIEKGASLAAKNANGWTPVMVACSWHNNWLEGILSREPYGQARTMPSQHISLPLMSIVKIARECGWRKTKHESESTDPCSICLESTCTVAVEGCHHEFCTLCALYLCSIDSVTTIRHGPPGSVACPLCRHAIVKFMKLPGTRQFKDLMMVNLSTSRRASGTVIASNSDSSIAKQLSKFVLGYRRSPRHPSSSFRSLSFQRLLRYKFLHQT